MSLGSNISRLRKKQNLSQPELAEQINVSIKKISAWETNESIPDLYQAKKLAKALNTTIDELVNFEQSSEEIDNIKLTDVSDVWNKIKPHLKEKMTSVSYEIWFENINEAYITKTDFIICTSSEIACKHIETHYQELLLETINQVYSKEIKKVYVILKE